MPYIIPGFYIKSIEFDFRALFSPKSQIQTCLFYPIQQLDSESMTFSQKPSWPYKTKKIFVTNLIKDDLFS